MGTFVTNPSEALPGPKTGTRTVPEGASADEYFIASDYNALRGACNDLRDAVTNSGLSVTATGSTQARSLAARFADTKNVLDFGADAGGTADSSSAFAAAVTALPESGGTIIVPAGTYRLNLSITKSNVTIRGMGRRATFLKPWSNASVISIAATTTAIQGFALSDVGFLASGTSTTSPAISISGTNINDWHSFHRVYADGFTNAISITGRTIWSRFIDGEITGDLGSGVYMHTSEPVNHVLFESWRVAGSASNGFHINCIAGGTQGVFYTITLHAVNSENNTGHGIYASNVDVFKVTGSYIENNGATSAGISLAGTYARGLDIRGNLIWGAGHGFVDAANWTTGVVEGNVFSNTSDNISVATSNDESLLRIGSNRENAVARVITADGNGRTHYTSASPLVLEPRSFATAPTTVKDINFVQFTNASPITINNLTGGDPGQVLYLVKIGSGNVTLTHANGGAGSLYLSGAANVTLGSTADGVQLINDGSGWREVGRTP